ncbi:MAG: response regulator transcription factor [Tannerellaceae bacterium]|jgi:DNA-binding response OmpR family regulator|nr:response regulator transcription factor [Tannerellaceae bacterium]
MNNDQVYIIIFDSDADLGAKVAEYLRSANCTVDAFQDANVARKSFERNPADFCIIALDKVAVSEAIELSKIVKARHPEVALIFTSNHHDVNFLAKAYSLGADDFLRKPFANEELLMRIKAIRRRMKAVNNSQLQTFAIGRYSLDAVKQTLSIDGKLVKLTTKECDLLVYLSENMNNLVLRENILKSVWKNDSYYNARSMDVYITKLRALIKEDPCVGIVNVHGKGYKLLVIEEANRAVIIRP